MSYNHQVGTGGGCPFYQDALRHFGRWQERWREPILTALLVMLALEVFVNIPLSESHLSAPPVFVAAEFFLILSAVLVASRNRVAAMAVLLSSVAAMIGNAMRIENPTAFNILLGSVSSVLFMAALGAVVWGAVFGSGRVTHHRIQGAIVLYLIIALAFAAAYQIMIVLIPGAITPLPADSDHSVVGPRLVYFSLVTLTSTGYGDILPLHPIARSLANLETVIGQLFPATLLARIVTLELQARRP
jgi:Ion channel